VAQRRTLFYSLVIAGILAGAVGGLLMAASIDSLNDQLVTTRGVLTHAESRIGRLEAALRRTSDENERLRESVDRRQTCASRRSGSAGGPHVWLLPDHGPVGTRVRFVGDCFLNVSAQDVLGAYGIFLLHQFLRPRECEIIAAPSRFALRIGNRGRAGGFFTVPSRGACFQHLYGRRVTPALYSVGIGCHACTVAAFRVTGG
jgi:hypothetical protein